MATLSNWMENIKNNTLKLHDIAYLPGSYDPYSYKSLDYPLKNMPIIKEIYEQLNFNQTLTLTEQLNAGTRVFRIKINKKDDIYYIISVSMGGDIIINGTLVDFIKEINSFLDINKKEVIMLNIDLQYFDLKKFTNKVSVYDSSTFSSTVSKIIDDLKGIPDQTFKSSNIIKYIYDDDGVPKNVMKDLLSSLYGKIIFAYCSKCITLKLDKYYHFFENDKLYENYEKFANKYSAPNNENSTSDIIFNYVSTYEKNTHTSLISMLFIVTFVITFLILSTSNFFIWKKIPKDFLPLYLCTLMGIFILLYLVIYNELLKIYSNTTLSLLFKKFLKNNKKYFNLDNKFSGTDKLYNSLIIYSNVDADTNKYIINLTMKYLDETEIV